MKKSSLLRPSFNLIMCVACVACVAASADVGLAQQPAYASTYYPAPQPTFGDRVRSAGQSVGDFVRRKFYGEPAPGAYPQQPVYHRPPGSSAQSGYQARSYNLDAPAQSNAPGTGGGTGFQPADRKTTPKYATPPKPAPVKKVDEPKPKVKNKDVPAPTVSKKRSAEPEPVAKKRYAPATPSTFAKSKATSERKRTEDEPPPPLSTTLTAPTPPEPPRYEAPPEPKTEAKLSNQNSGTSGGGISPTIGGSEYSLTPPSPEKEEPVGSKSSQKSPSTTSRTTADTSGTTDAGTKSSGSFLIGKKTSKAGRVVSPYAPYNELDITGLPTGSLALDPTTQRVFQVP